MATKKGKGKGKGGKKCAIAAVVCAVPFVVAGCKTVPATDDQGNEIPGAPPVVEPDPGAINATAIAVGTALGGPVGGLIAALGGAAVFGTAATVINQQRKKREEEEWEVVDEGS